MTIHWKAVEQYFTVVLFVNPLTPRVKPVVMQSFLTFDSMNRTLKRDHLLESSTLLWCFRVFQFHPVCNFGKFIKFGLDTGKKGFKKHSNKVCSKYSSDGVLNFSWSKWADKGRVWMSVYTRRKFHGIATVPGVRCLLVSFKDISKKKM